MLHGRCFTWDTLPKWKWVWTVIPNIIQVILELTLRNHRLFLSEHYLALSLPGTVPGDTSTDIWGGRSFVSTFHCWDLLDGCYRNWIGSGWGSGMVFFCYHVCWSSRTLQEESSWGTHTVACILPLHSAEFEAFLCPKEPSSYYSSFCH